ncbi:MAG TPA: ORC1-type DNA replication protein [Candidatus Thermoplasmatota archaeon]|nr:ORC1-type DNA replication protein [Candidatus Thermoplasmatota archaeon]
MGRDWRDATTSRDGLFDSLLRSEPMFRNKEVLRPSYTPEELPHRTTQINQLATILVAALRGETPSNVFIYGKTGTGKTAVTRFVGKELQRTGQEKDKNVFFIYINCELVDTQYRVLTHIANHFIEDWNDRIPFTGWPTDEVYDKLKKKIDEKDGACIIVLDEIDKLVFKAGDDVLYNLSRINDNLTRAKVSVIGISNDLKFTEFLDPRVKSSLGEEEVIFPPYDALQLQDILKQRAHVAFKEDSLDPSVIPLCAGLAAQEHGDARRALDLLRVAAELAEREGQKVITEKFVRKAQNKIELDRVTEVVRTLPTQSKLVLLSTILGEEQGTKGLTTGEVYDTYRELCQEVHMDVLTQRRVTDLISELDMLGILQARVISKGRYGRTKEIQMSVPLEETKAVLREDPVLEPIVGFSPKKQARLF